MATLINLTPNPITIHGTSDVITVPPSGKVARVSSTPGVVRHILPCGAPVYTAPTFGVVEGLPDPTPGILYIVSAVVLSRCVGRDDVVGPGTGPADGAIRDEAGRITAVTRLNMAPSV